MVDLKVNIAGIDLKNPVIAASGTFGFGREYSEFIDLNRLGGIATKGLTLNPRQGNKPPRIAETPSGILNSVGLQNPGVKAFIEDEIPFLKKFNTSIIANVAGSTIEEYCEVVEMLSEQDVDAIELNISCPNVREGCLAFGTNKEGTGFLTKEVRKLCKKPLIVKLSPNVTDISEIALSAEANGADAVSLINTLVGMSIDIDERRPILANIVGGLSGPAVKPVAVRMVYEVSQSVKIPVIGMGGISKWDDAIEFFLAGASAIMVGTANMSNPRATIEVIEGIEKYLESNHFSSIGEIVGLLKTEQ
ncbi:MAG: dihydroorotate dehydrogenase [Clostridia bacterium]|jgi:dihydroorotate dehydrogenase (NAD+) catalytic subunit